MTSTLAPSNEWCAHYWWGTLSLRTFHSRSESNTWFLCAARITWFCQFFHTIQRTTTATTLFWSKITDFNPMWSIMGGSNSKIGWTQRKIDRLTSPLLSTTWALQWTWRWQNGDTETDQPILRLNLLQPSRRRRRRTRRRRRRAIVLTFVIILN